MLNTRLVKSALILAAGLLMAGTVAAKEMKIAYVDVQAVAAKIPQSAAMQETIRSEFAQRIETVGKLEKDINFNIEKSKMIQKKRKNIIESLLERILEDEDFLNKLFSNKIVKEKIIDILKD